MRVRTQAGGQTARDVRIGQWAPDEGGYVTARIAAVDCQANRVAVPMSQPMVRAVQVGRTLRIYNESRAALYRVIDTDQEGDLIWMSLNDSALLARGQVVAVEDSRLQLDSYLTFARWRPVTDGELVPGPDYYAGAWLTQETGQFQVAGAVQEDENERNTIYLQEPVDARKLRALEHQSVSIWQYGVGDQLELALIEE